MRLFLSLACYPRSKLAQTFCFSKLTQTMSHQRPASPCRNGGERAGAGFGGERVGRRSERAERRGHRGVGGWRGFEDRLAAWHASRLAKSLQSRRGWASLPESRGRASLAALALAVRLSASWRKWWPGAARAHTHRLAATLGHYALVRPGVGPTVANDAVGYTLMLVLMLSGLLASGRMRQAPFPQWRGSGDR